MTDKTQNREYMPFDPNKGWPVGNDIFYECLECKCVLSSVIEGDCLCHNLYVDVDSGRIGANDVGKIRLFRKINVY